MGYRTPLESRIAKKTTRAILEFGMVEDGDRVMVGLSGGKDSWALLEMLHVLRQRAPIRFSIIAVNVDSGYKEYKHDLIRSTCDARGWDLRIEPTRRRARCARGCGGACSTASPRRLERRRSRSATMPTTSSRRF
jgi:tRNA 2-thiocytidine biosynthesis protein TtcA